MIFKSSVILATLKHLEGKGIRVTLHSSFLIPWHKLASHLSRAAICDAALRTVAGACVMGHHHSALMIEATRRIDHTPRKPINTTRATSSVNCRPTITTITNHKSLLLAFIYVFRKPEA
jgi:hypothetical protein